MVTTPLSPMALLQGLRGENKTPTTAKPRSRFVQQQVAENIWTAFNSASFIYIYIYIISRQIRNYTYFPRGFLVALNFNTLVERLFRNMAYIVIKILVACVLKKLSDVIGCNYFNNPYFQ